MKDYRLLLIYCFLISLLTHILHTADSCAKAGAKKTKRRLREGWAADQACFNKLRREEG